MSLLNSFMWYFIFCLVMVNVVLCCLGVIVGVFCFVCDIVVFFVVFVLCCLCCLFDLVLFVVCCGVVWWLCCCCGVVVVCCVCVDFCVMV